MILRIGSALRRRLDQGRSEQGDERGAVAVVVALLLLPVLLASAALGIDVSNWYWQGQRLQKAADAAALSGAVDLITTGLSAATVTAKKTASQNGFVDPTVDPTNSNATVAASIASGPTLLKVAITSSTTNPFGYLFGNPKQTLTRSAIATYAGPVAMGSPCHYFGNQPAGGNPTTGAATPATSACNTTPDFWANVAGPGSPKANGDQFATRGCASGDSGCNGSTNTDYTPSGYFYKVSVTKPVSSITFQAFDPIMAEVGDNCTANLPASWAKDKPNDYETIAGDAANRYKSGQTAYCTGDHEFDADATKAVTTFAVRDPSPSGNPLDAPVHAGCAKQYKGFGNTIDFTKALDKTQGAAYNDELARDFRQWSTLCTISNPTVGTDYYVQVRTNLPYGTSDSVHLSSATDDFPSMAWSGHNRFALRATAATTDAVSIAGFGKMAIYTNSNSAQTQFHLARIRPGAAGQILDIKLFDAGDADNPGTITILPPADAKAGTSPLTLNNCLGMGDVVGSPTSGSALNSSCQLTNVSSANGWNGKLQVIRVQLPVNYTCTDSDPNGCWFQIRFNFSGGDRDTTSWSTSLDGQPVRIVQ